MVSLKTRIKNNFDRASLMYNDFSSVQRLSGKFLIEKLLHLIPFYPKTILDLGCGTGYTSELLLKHYPNSFFTLNDISEKMVDVCREKFSYKNFSFITGDLEKINFTNHDLTVSNFVLQWVEEMEKNLEKFYKKSTIFAFSSLLNGTFQEWQNILNNYGASSFLKKYPLEQDLISYCNKLSADFYFWTKEFQIQLPNAYAFMKYLQNIGASTNHKHLSYNILKSLIKTQSEPFTVTYRAFFGVFRK